MLQFNIYSTRHIQYYSFNTEHNMAVHTSLWSYYPNEFDKLWSVDCRNLPKYV